MVSQGAQTNGILLPNGRKLMKSYSEAGGKFQLTNESSDKNSDHEPLQRTQSEEPPRSPYVVKTPPGSPEPLPSESPSITVQKSEHSQEEESDRCTEEENEEEESLPYETKTQKEIIIDFEPQASPVKKKPLLKTASDGEILLDKRRAQRLSIDSELLPDKVLTSVSHDNICIGDNEPTRSFTPYFQNSPIRHEDIFKTLSDEFPATQELPVNFRPQDSIDEEFHENLIYGGLFRKRSSSYSEAFEEGENDDEDEEDDDDEEEDGVVPTLQLMPDQKISPFASTDSLANDIRYENLIK